MPGWRFAAGLVAGLALGGCTLPPATPPLPDPAQIAAHEWDHGPPWGAEEVPWVAPPQLLAYAPGYWGPGYWRPSVGVRLGFGRGHWGRGAVGFRGGRHGGGRGRR